MCCTLVSLTTYSRLLCSKTATVRTSWMSEIGSAPLEQIHFSFLLLSFIIMADSYWSVPPSGLSSVFLHSYELIFWKHYITTLDNVNTTSCELQAWLVSLQEQNRLPRSPVWVLALFPWNSDRWQRRTKPYWRHVHFLYVPRVHCPNTMNSNVFLKACKIHI